MPPDYSRYPLWTQIVAIVSVAYGVGVLAFFAARAVDPQAPLIAMLDYLAPLFFVPLIVLLPLAIVSRSHAALAMPVVLIILFGLLYGAVYLPRARPAPGVRSVTFMTFNLQAGVPPPASLIAAIARENPDVVALEELEPYPAGVIRQELEGQYPYMVMAPLDHDTALLSRYPVVASAWFAPAGTGRAALAATLDVQGAVWRVIVAHPQPPHILWRWRGRIPWGIDVTALNAEVADIAQRAARLEGRTVVLGDFNMSSGSLAYRNMARVLIDSYLEAGWGLGLTFPHKAHLGVLPLLGPFTRLDYVFHSADLYAEQARVGCHEGSDHCYVWVRMGLARAIPQP